MKQDKELLKAADYLGRVLMKRVVDLEERERQVLSKHKLFHKPNYKWLIEEYKKLTAGAMISFTDIYEKQDLQDKLDLENGSKSISEMIIGSLGQVKTNNSLFAVTVEQAYEAFCAILASKIDLFVHMDESHDSEDATSVFLSLRINEEEKPRLDSILEQLEPLYVEMFNKYH